MIPGTVLSQALATPALWCQSCHHVPRSGLCDCRLLQALSTGQEASSSWPLSPLTPVSTVPFPPAGFVSSFNTARPHLTPGPVTGGTVQVWSYHNTCCTAQSPGFHVLSQSLEATEGQDYIFSLLIIAGA